MTVIERNFGKRTRQTIRRFGELLCLDALHEANIKANPVPYLERASERIFQLERALFEAAQAVAPPAEGSPSGEWVQVDKAEYERLLRCRDIVEKALAEHARDEEF
ncbi:MAG: hypothetical protein LOY00_04120 [Methylocaldum sp.]|nr:hypothetical protein [Methylocaldum sp.]